MIVGYPYKVKALAAVQVNTKVLKEPAVIAAVNWDVILVLVARVQVDVEALSIYKTTTYGGKRRNQQVESS